MNKKCSINCYNNFKGLFESFFFLVNTEIFMKNIFTTIICAVFFLVPSDSFSGGHEKDDHDHYHGIEATANDWITALYTGKSESIETVENNMADDGQSVQGRYVGFGFTWDPRENEMRVGRVTPNSPADGALEVGDLFLEVNGVKAIPENFESLGFRGKPGAEIAAVIESKPGVSSNSVMTLSLTKDIASSFFPSCKDGIVTLKYIFLLRFHNFQLHLLRQ